METLDLHGKTISKGAYVRYTGTGTFGEISDIKTENHETWAKLKEEKLWYNSEFLEVIEKPEEIEKLKRIKKEDLVKKLKKKQHDLEGVDMSSELCDGGG